MMEQILKVLWNVTLSASFLIALLLVIRRLFFGKINPKWQYVAWILVALRLLIPFSVESMFSAMNVLQPATQQVEELFLPAVVAQPPYEQDPIAPAEPNQQNISVKPPADFTAPIPGMPGDSTTPDESSGVQLTLILFIVWISGIALVLIYMTFVNLRFMGSIRKNHRFAEGERLTYTLIGKPVPVYMDETAPSPCLAGVLRPAIIITPQSAKTLERLRYVLLHELCHYQRRDNIFALLRNLMCAAYWFNPLVWVAASVSRKDCELACDAAVLRRLRGDETIAYGETLLALIRRNPDARQLLQNTTMMSNRKKTIEERIRFIAERPKPMLITMICAVVLVLASVLVACTAAINNAVPDDGKGNETEQTGELSQEPYPDTFVDEQWRDGYKGVLLNNADFYSTDWQKNMNLSQANTEFGKSIYIKKFTVIDLDSDGIPEVVLWRSLSEDNDVGVEILHYKDGIVYGYAPTYRQFYNLKSDGTYTVSAGVSDWGFGTMRFAENTYYNNKIAYCSSGGSAANENVTVSYFISEENVTEEAFLAAYGLQNAKPDAMWYEFTADNMEKLLLAAKVTGITAAITPYNADEHGFFYEFDLMVTLENGEVLRKAYNYGNFYIRGVDYVELHFVDLTQDGRDELIMIVPNATSNYEAANIHVLRVDGDGLTELLTILDSPNSQDNPFFMETCKDSLFVIPHIAADENLPMYTPENYETFCTGAALVQTDNGVELWVRHLMKDSTPYSIIRWDGNGWYVAEQGIHLSPMTVEPWVDAYINAMLDAVDGEHRAFSLADVTNDGIPELFFASFGSGGRWINGGLSYLDGKVTNIMVPDGFMQSELELYRNMNTGSLIWIAGDTHRNGYGEYTHEWYIMDFNDMASVKQDLLFGWSERINDNQIGWQYLLYGSDGTGSYESSQKVSLEKLLEKQEQFFNAYELMEAATPFESVISFMNSYDSANPIKLAEGNLNRSLLTMYLSNWRNNVTFDKPKNRVPVSALDESANEPFETSIEAVIQAIDDRVSWIDEGLGGYPLQGDESVVLGDFDYRAGEVYKDYYDGSDLVYRRGSEYYDKNEGDVFYDLYYDVEGHLIFAHITQYRHPYYFIYFSNDTAIRLIQGERENEEETVFDEDMIHAITLCLENAYK